MILGNFSESNASIYTKAFTQKNKTKYGLDARYRECNSKFFIIFQLIEKILINIRLAS